MMGRQRAGEPLDARRRSGPNRAVAPLKVIVRMKTEAAIFDYDGVLVELRPEKAVALFHGRAPLGVRELHRRWEVWCTEHAGEGRQAIEMWRAFWTELARQVGIAEGPLAEICAVDPFELFRLCPDTLAALKEARQSGIKLGVLSNSALPGLSSPLAPIALSEVVDVISVPRPGKPIKPHPEAYRDIAQRLGTVPERCLFFDNDPSFVEAARALGMKAYVVFRGGKGEAGDPLALRDLVGIRALVEAG